MLQAPPASPSPLRVVRRQTTRSSVRVLVRPRRPSLLEPRLVGDPWIIDQADEYLALCFNDWPLATVRGLPVDLPFFNHLLERLRNRPARRR